MAKKTVTPASATSQLSATNSQPVSTNKESATMATKKLTPSATTSQLPATNSQPASVSFAPGESYEPNKLYSLALKDIEVDFDKSSRVSTIDDAEIIELAENISKFGMLQPILVRAGSEGFMIVAGERRYRAAIVAGWDSIPAMFNTENPALVSLVENLQRADLTGVQKAESLARLQQSDPKLFTVKYLSKMIGKHTNSISEDLKLAELPIEARDKYRNDIRCNCSLLRTARQAYEASQAELGVEPTAEKYTAGLIEYIDTILSNGTTVNQLRVKRAAVKAKAKAKADAALPEVPSSDVTVSDSITDLGEFAESIESESAAAAVTVATVELTEIDVPSTISVVKTETPADVAVASVKKLHKSLIDVVSDFDLEHRQTIASLLKEILALVE